MANFQGTFRSNYFKVKDKDKFQSFIDSLVAEDAVNVWENKDGHVAIGGYCPFPIVDIEDVSTDDFYAEIAGHLEDHEICILQEAGSEKLRYVSGTSIAIDQTGIIAKVGLSDIYAKIGEKIGVLKAAKVTECAY